MVALPGWFSSIVGLPGAVSFRKFEAIVRRSATLSVDELTLELTTGGSLPREATAQFLALARETASRTLGLRPFDEQLVACCALLAGNAVEMDTGEGKTLVGALAAAGHALAGRRVHVLSVNDYLAERDAHWMTPFFDALGICVGWVGQATAFDERHRAYRCDVVYAPVSEVGFDVLRDRFAVGSEGRVAPAFDVAIVDEADAVMIDEAMVPLVLAGTSDHTADDFELATALVAELVPDRDFAIDADQATVTLTDEGLDALEAALGGVNLYASDHVPTLTRINLALHARVLVRRDVDYLVHDGAVRLINTGRGRIAQLQRWPDGLHAAVEAKERLAVSAPGVVLDSLTIQDLLLRYSTLSGMSGTVLTVAEDLLEFYSLPSGRVERHRPNIRVDLPDRIALTAEQKVDTVVSEVAARHATGQPVLIGTQDVAESESLAARLAQANITARVLNARNDAEEAAIVARAGEFGAVTISTQMSGRGTDIRLGGSDEADRDRVVASGGLAVIATGRYPSKRLDAQLRGRAGRQGDPGTSVSVVALEDPLVQSHAPAHLLTQIERRGDELDDDRRHYIVDSSQDIAAAQRLDRHRATWAYTRAIAAQRATVLRHRERVEAGELAIAAPAHLDAADPLLLETLVRSVTLHYLDEYWMDHLALLQEVRDGIHLRALAGQKPAEEFHRIALREFHGFFEAIDVAVASFLETLTVADVGRDLDELGLRDPPRRGPTW